MGDFLKAWWFPIVLAIVVVVAGVVYINRLRERATTAEKERDVARMETLGANAAHEATAARLRKEAAHLLASYTGLEDEVAKLKEAMAGAKPTGTLSGTTASLPVSSTTPPSPTAKPCPGEDAGPACVLTVADRISLNTAMITMQGDSGAVGVAGIIQAWRGGEPPVLLAEGPLKLDVQIPKTDDLPGWGAGVVVVGGRSGWWLGPLVSPPPLRVFGLNGSLLVGAGVGGSGEWGGLAAGLLRW